MDTAGVPGELGQPTELHCHLWETTPVKENKVYTIGYEGAGLEDFLATLLTAGVESIIDIRDYPGSRRAGFSKKALQAHAEGAGINYVHLKGLGDPKAGREAARAGKFDEFRAIFETHMLSDTAQQDLAAAIDLAGGAPSCLMCYERDPQHCHRAIVAVKIQKSSDFEVMHLGVQKNAARKYGAPIERGDIKNGK